MTKYVQLGILAALVLVAVLLGLNLMNDRAAAPAEPPIAAATPVPEDVPTPTAEPAAETTPETDSPASAPSPAKSAPAVTPPAKQPANKTTASAPAKPSPSGGSASVGAKSTSPATPPQEVAKVDPPSAMPDTRSLPTPPVAQPATTSSTERYDLMRPGSSAASVPAPPAPPRTVTIPSGTILTIRTIQTLSSKSNAAGDTFTGTLDQPLVLEDMVIAERGSRVEGKVTEVTDSGRVKGVAQIAITLTRLNTSDGQTVDVATQNFPVEAEKTTKSDATKVGIATGIGAALGAIFGGGKGAAIGAATGGAAGAGTVLVSKGKPAEIPSETRINFRLEKPLVLTEKINTK
ncbi:MAG: hypothetical protein U5J83_16680 [Bryobacterales bacterium]|nr:hypothetical protein [Bryobacterales bacterium]